MLRNGKIGVKNVLSVINHNHSSIITVSAHNSATGIQEAANWAASWAASWTSCELLNKSLT